MLPLHEVCILYTVTGHSEFAYPDKFHNTEVLYSKHHIMELDPISFWTSDQWGIKPVTILA